MNGRQYFLDLAAAGLRMPIGTDLVLHEKPDAKVIVRDGRRLGEVFVESARRYRTSLAIGLMDLTLEKEVLLDLLGVQTPEPETFHFSSLPDEAALARFEERLGKPLDARTQAFVDAVGVVRTHRDLVPVGMTIGPFSLMTKLLADPITPMFLAGQGMTAEDEPEIGLIETMLTLGEKVIRRSIAAQLAAGAKAIFIAEPAASTAFISPNQLDAGATHWERYVMQPNRRIRDQIEAAGAQLVFHCCGELCDRMVEQFGTLHPAMLSLGASRKLWEDQRLVPADTVMFGNLPTKKFYSDQAITVAQVKATTCNLLAQMKQTGHPFILGSECDVLSVAGCEHSIRTKVDMMLECKCDGEY